MRAPITLCGWIQVWSEKNTGQERPSLIGVPRWIAGVASHQAQRLSKNLLLKRIIPYIIAIALRLILRAKAAKAIGES
jgi:hypothetical protein